MAFEAGHVGLDSLRALAMQGLLEGALTCNLESCKHYVLDKETKLKFGTVIYRKEGLLDLVHMDFWEPIKTASLGAHRYFIFFVDISLSIVRYYPIRQRFKVLNLFVKWKKLWRNILIGRSKCSNLIMLGSTIGVSSCNLVRTIVLICTSQFRTDWVAKELNHVLLEKI